MTATPSSFDPRRLGLAAGFVLIAAAAGWLWLRPGPIAVERAEVTQGPMQVTLDEQGETRSHDRWTLAAPFTGRVLRAALHEGDAVRSGQELLRLAPVPLSVRERDEQQGRIAAADAGVGEAGEREKRTRSELAQARRERARIEQLVAQGFMSPQAAERARLAEQAALDEVRAAEFRSRSARADAQAARAGLAALAGGAAGVSATVPLRAPADGRVLRIHEQSERVVAAGTPLLTIGEQSRMEVVVELLSTDAVRIAPGMTVRVDGWGGDRPLPGRVRAVEPYAFTKVSALGVEEKRANAIIDLDERPDALGDGYRVLARIVTWQAARTRQAPASAFFRCGESWCAFTIDDGRARRREVRLGHRTPTQVEILDGLPAGAMLVRHPPNGLADGARVLVR